MLTACICWPLELVRASLRDRGTPRADILDAVCFTLRAPQRPTERGRSSSPRAGRHRNSSASNRSVTSAVGISESAHGWIAAIAGGIAGAVTLIGFVRSQSHPGS